MKAHIIENGIVINTIEVDSLDFLPNLVEATEGGIGWAYDGVNFTAPLPTPEPIPQSLTPRQIRLQLTALGLRQAVEDWVATQSIDIKDWWEFSLSIDRDNQMLIDAATHFGLTGEQLDQLFIEAAKL